METENIKMNTGLQPTPEDKRDLQLGAFFRLPNVEDLPESFAYEPFKIKDQKFSDFCSAFAVTAASELQEGVELNPLFSFAASKQITQDPESWGQNLRDAIKAHTKYGCVEEAESPFKLEDINEHYEDKRTLESWPEDTILKAQKHIKKSYWKITGQYDHFDNIRSAMWRFREEKRAVIFGVEFGWNPKDMVLSTQNHNPKKASGHAMTFLGWESEDYLYVQQSYGDKIGQGGILLMDRDAVNTLTEKYGAYMLIDMDPEDAKYYTENNIKEGDSWIVELIKVIKKFLEDIIGIKNKNQ